MSNNTCIVVGFRPDLQMRERYALGEPKGKRAKAMWMCDGYALVENENGLYLKDDTRSSQTTIDQVDFLTSFIEYYEYLGAFENVLIDGHRFNIGQQSMKKFRREMREIIEDCNPWAPIAMFNFHN